MEKMPNPEQPEQRCLTQAVATVVGPTAAVVAAYYLNKPKNPAPPPAQSSWNSAAARAVRRCVLRQRTPNEIRARLERLELRFGRR